MRGWTRLTAPPEVRIVWSEDETRAQSISAAQTPNSMNEGGKRFHGGSISVSSKRIVNPEKLNRKGLLIIQNLIS